MSERKKKEEVEEQETVDAEVPEVEENTTDETENNICEDKIKELESKIKEWENKYLRLFAEYDNYQKRSKREKDACFSDAVVDVVAEVLPISDNLDRALAVEVESDEAKKILEGVTMIKKQMTDTLSKLDVSEIEAVGEEFDPKLHNAVMHVEDENITDNTIIEEFMKGYRYKKDRVIRHSMVKVAN